MSKKFFKVGALPRKSNDGVLKPLVKWIVSPWWWCFLYLTGRVTFFPTGRDMFTRRVKGYFLPQWKDSCIYTPMERFPKYVANILEPGDPRMLTRFNIVPSLLIWVLPKPIYDTSISLYANNGWMFVSLNAFRGNTVSFWADSQHSL